MDLLTIDEANAVLKAANDIKTAYPHTRVGQNIMNNLPESIRLRITNTELDMFECNDYDKCVQILFSDNITLIK